MAETQAQSPAAGTSYDSSDSEAAVGADGMAAEFAGADHGLAEHGSAAVRGSASVGGIMSDGLNADGGVAASGRASVPGDGGHGHGADVKIGKASPLGRFEPNSGAPYGDQRPSSPNVPGPISRGTAVAGRSGVRTPPAGGSGRVADAVRSARATVATAAARGPRRARLFVKRIDPWSVMKFSFAVSFVLFFVLIVATSVLYLALDQMNVFSDINKAISQLFGGKTSVKITATTVIGAAGAIGLVMVVLFTALSTLGAFIYNVCADLVGGIEITLSEKE